MGVSEIRWLKQLEEDTMLSGPTARSATWRRKRSGLKLKTSEKLHNNGTQNWVTAKPISWLYKNWLRHRGLVTDIVSVDSFSLPGIARNHSVSSAILKILRNGPEYSRLFFVCMTIDCFLHN